MSVKGFFLKDRFPGNVGNEENILQAAQAALLFILLVVLFRKIIAFRFGNGEFIRTIQLLLGKDFPHGQKDAYQKESQQYEL